MRMVPRPKPYLSCSILPAAQRAYTRAGEMPRDRAVSFTVINVFDERRIGTACSGLRPTIETLLVMRTPQSVKTNVSRKNSAGNFFLPCLTHRHQGPARLVAV